jgi:predicted flap endonuclease-1-like 5' DNA nuclease
MLLMFKNICSDAWLETLLWLLPAFLLGLFLGWLIWGRRIKELTNQITSLEADLRACRAEKDRLNTQIGSLKASSNASGNANLNANASANANNDATLRTRISSLETALADCEASKKTALAAAAVASTAAIATSTAAPSTNASIAGSGYTTPNQNRRDDLKVVEGIGPAIEKLCNNNGITTWAQLSTTATDVLKTMLDKAGPNYRIHNPSTWAAQAALAHEGKWDELKKWQNDLNGGKV